MSKSEVHADIWVTEHVSPYDVYHHGIKRVLIHKETKFQDMAIVESGSSGRALVLDGKWQSCVGDEFLYHEPLVHPACLIHGNPKNVLVLGGGEGATIREVLKWKSVTNVTMIDIDGEVVEACKEFLPEMHQGSFEDPRTTLIIGDALEFIDETDIKWDVVISDLSDPIEEGPSFKLFTKEYFEGIKMILAKNGVFTVQAGPVSPMEMDLHVRLINTLKAVFPHVHSYASYVPTYVSPWGFGIASDKKFDTQFEPKVIDEALGSKTKGTFRMFDGQSFLGIFQQPKHIREAIEKETEVYTQLAPPKFFGKGQG
jgi:spermidine synthase